MLTKVITVLEKIVSPLKSMTLAISLLLLFLMMSLTFSDVISRFIIKPIHGTHEMTYLGLSIMVFLSFGYTQSKKGHITVGVFVDLLPKRIQALVDVAIYTASLIILSLLVWQTYEFGVRKFTSYTGDLQLRISIFVFICAIGLLVYVIVIILDLLKSLQKVVEKNDS